MAYQEESTGSNFVWAVALVIIVAIIAAVVYYGGLFKRTQKQEVDVEISVPAR